MTNSRGSKRKINHDEVVAYAKANPTVIQGDVAKHFGTSQGRVSLILRAAGVEAVHRGRPCKQKRNETNLQHEWERILQSAGLGVDRGMRLNKQRILYGFDPHAKEANYQSVTQNN